MSSTALVHEVGLRDLLRDTRHLGARAASDLADWLAWLSLDGKADRTLYGYMRTIAGLLRAPVNWQAIETLREIVDEVAGGYDENDPTFAQEWAALSVVEEALEAAERFENAVRIFDVMLNEPAAKGLMSADDYQTYFRGAWLGVEEAAEHVRVALARAREGIKP